MGMIYFNQLPQTLEEMKMNPLSDLRNPDATAALTVAALCVYPQNPQEAIRMLDFLSGPEPLSTFKKQFLADRFRGKPYIAKSFFQGATPQNGYEPSRPYAINVIQNQYSTNQFSQGYLTLWLQSGGADSPRSLQLRNKPSTGQWFLVDQMLLSDIRIPVAEDPWA